MIRIFMFLFAMALPGQLVCSDYMRKWLPSFQWPSREQLAQFFVRRQQQPPIVPMPNPMEMTINFDEWHKRLSGVPTPATIADIIGKETLKNPNGLDPDFKVGQESWRKLYLATQEATKIQWPELENAATIIVNSMKNSKLTDPKAWVDGNPLSHESFERQAALDESLYVSGIIVEPGTKIYAFGDPQDDALSPMKILATLQELGVMDWENKFKVVNPKKNKLWFAGDDHDKGWTGTEFTIVKAGLLQSNPEGTIFGVRGNHDDTSAAENDKGFQRELQTKFPEKFKRKAKSYASSFDETSKAKINRIGQLYRQPLSLFIGVRTTNDEGAEEIKYQQFFHAAPDFRYNPKKLFAALHTRKNNEIVHERYPVHFADGTNPEVEKLLKKNVDLADAFEKIKKQDVTELQYASFTAGYMLDQKIDAHTTCRFERNKILPGGVLWNTFLQDYRYEYKPYKVQKLGRTYLPTFARSYMPKWFWGARNARESSSSVIAAWSGHQHFSESTYKTLGYQKPNIMDRMWLGHGCTQLWGDYSEVLNLRDERFVEKGGFYKLAPLCNNIYGIPSSSMEKDEYPGFNWSSITEITIDVTPTLKTIQVPIFPQEKRAVEWDSKSFSPQIRFSVEPEM
jgi:hypothetical protein